MNEDLCKRCCGLAKDCYMLWYSESSDLYNAFWATTWRPKSEQCQFMFTFNNDVKIQFEFYNILQNLPRNPRILNTALAMRFLTPPKECPFYTEHVIFDLNRGEK